MEFSSLKNSSKSIGSFTGILVRASDVVIWLFKGLLPPAGRSVGVGYPLDRAGSEKVKLVGRWKAKEICGVSGVVALIIFTKLDSLSIGCCRRTLSPAWLWGLELPGCIVNMFGITSPQALT